MTGLLAQSGLERRAQAHNLNWPCRVRALPGDWGTKESQLPENPSRGEDEGFLVGGGCWLDQRQRNVGLSLQSGDSGIDTREYFPTAALIFM